jgi:hypothetical protein
MKTQLEAYKLLLLLMISMLLAGCAGLGQTPMPTPTPIPLSPEELADQFEYAWYEVSFDDLIPNDLDVELAQCWNGMGMDDQGRIYIGFTSFRDGGKSEDFVVFRYDPSTEQREFLGTFQNVAAANSNLQEGESIPKGHTRMIFADGVMYMGSQGFHDFKQEIDDLPRYRGSHIFAYHTRNESWLDLSAGLPGGVVTEHQGIVAPSGNIYSYRGTEEPFQRGETHPVWVYNIHTGEDIAAGRLIQFQYGPTLSPDESKILFVPSTLERPQGTGELYEYDIATGEVTYIQQLPIGIYTSADLRDDKNIYLAHFGSQENLWSGRVRLMVITVPQEPQP